MSVNALFAVSLPVTPTHLSGKTASGASMFALIASLAFAAPSIQAVAAGYAEVCSTNLADADCNRLIVTGTSPDEQEMLKLDCGSTNLARCETAWTKVLTAIGNRPEGMLGFVTEPAPKPTAILVESKGGHIGPPVPPPPPVVEEDPCAKVGGFKPKRGTGVIGSVRGKDGRECFGPGIKQANDMAVFYNNRHDPSLVVASGIRRQEEKARTSAYVIVVNGDVQEQLVQLSPGKPLEVNLVEVSGVPGDVLAGIQYRIEGGDGVDHADVFQVSSRGLAVVSVIAGWTETRQILSSLVGQIVLYKFTQVTGDVEVYEGQRSFDYDAFAHGGVREILPAIGNWRR